MTTETPTRGGIWVVAQFALMISGLASVIWWHGQWTGWLSIVGGGALFIVAAFTGIHGKRELGRNRTVFPRPRQDGQLVTTGIYAYMRHPLYVSVMSFGFAWALLWRSWPALAIAALQVPFFDAKARLEERWLSKIFPGYDEYAQRVKRFIPNFY